MRALTLDLLAACENDAWFKANGISVIVTCTFRTQEEQAATYAQGRTREQLDAVGLTGVQPRPGNVVTWAVPGKSRHNVRDASGNPAAEGVDLLPLRHGKPVWGTAGAGMNDDPSDDLTNDLEVWQRLGALGKALGLEWAGEWPKPKREYPHFQRKGD